MIVKPSGLLIGIDTCEGDRPCIFILFAKNTAEVHSQAEITLVIISQDVIPMGFQQQR